jgi:hypothetical protein
MERRTLGTSHSRPLWTFEAGQSFAVRSIERGLASIHLETFLPLVVTTKSVSRHCLMALGVQNSTQWSCSVVDGYKAVSKPTASAFSQRVSSLHAGTEGVCSYLTRAAVCMSPLALIHQQSLICRGHVSLRLSHRCRERPIQAHSTQQRDCHNIAPYPNS